MTLADTTEAAERMALALAQGGLQKAASNITCTTAFWADIRVAQAPSRSR